MNKIIICLAAVFILTGCSGTKRVLGTQAVEDKLVEIKSANIIYSEKGHLSKIDFTLSQNVSVTSPNISHDGSMNLEFSGIRAVLENSIDLEFAASMIAVSPSETVDAKISGHIYLLQEIVTEVKSNYWLAFDIKAANGPEEIFIKSRSLIDTENYSVILNSLGNRAELFANVLSPMLNEVILNPGADVYTKNKKTYFNVSHTFNSSDVVGSAYVIFNSSNLFCGFLIDTTTFITTTEEGVTTSSKYILSADLEVEESITEHLFPEPKIFPVDEIPKLPY